MPNPATSTPVSSLLDRAAEASPEAPALVCGEDRITFGELARRARSRAAGLRQVGVEPGDHVGMWMHNGVELAVTVYAAAYVKALLVPMNTWHRPREMAYAVADSEITTLMVGEDIVGKSGHDAVGEVLAHQSSFPHLRSVLVNGEPLPGHPALQDCSGDPADELPERGIGEPSYMLYTSGTTGDAKGVVLDDAGVTADATLLGERLGLRPVDSYYCSVPLFHAGGLIFVLLASHAHGACVVTRSRFDPVEALDDIDRHRCSVIGGFEVIYSKLVEAADATGRRPPSLRTGWWVGTSGSFLRTEQRLGLLLTNLFGMTEASGNVASTPLEWDREHRAVSQGVPMAGRTVEVVDTLTEEELARGSVGELRVSGWGLMHGYWNKPEATAASFDERGRLRSGDAGMVDDTGCVHFLGRNDEALKVGGENVAPLEVEEVLSERSDVDEVAVVGVPDERYGHLLVAFVKPRPGVEVPSGEDLRAFVREQLASFKVPRRVELLDEFPRTSTGKIHKGDLARLITSTTSARDEVGVRSHQEEHS